uniref:Uncharacterized protein n=1 Tax=Octopus bimaculoides TaxID=37653 RepID=A0A0L8FVA4_OCTBM
MVNIFLFQQRDHIVNRNLNGNSDQRLDYSSNPVLPHFQSSKFLNIVKMNDPFCFFLNSTFNDTRNRLVLMSRLSNAKGKN